MKAEFLIENIEQFISALSKALPTHSQLPVLSNVLINITQEGLFLLATDLELGIQIKVPAKIEEEGAVTIPGKQFIEVLNSLPKDKVKIEYANDSFMLESRGNKIFFQTISREEFPSLFQEKGKNIYTFTRSEFKRIFQRLIFSTSIDEGRPQLTGVYLTQKEGYLDFVATDGYRMSLVRIPDKKILDVGTGIILPTKLITEALALKDGGESISLYIYQEGNQVLFETPNVTLVGRIIGGEFPHYERVIPEDHKTHVVIEKDAFLQSIRLSSVFARESANIIKLKLEQGILKLFAKSSGVGEGETHIEVEQTGDDNEIAFNAKFLTDVLRAVEESSIVMELNSSLESSVFKLEKDPHFLHIIMPVRVQE